jgi:hypothetical protein
MAEMTNAGLRCTNRLFEWVSSFALTMYGLQVITFPETLVRSRQAALLSIFTPFIYGALCLLVGVVRAVMLYKNGDWYTWGPRVRVLLALLAAVLYLQIAMSLLQWASPGTWAYTAFGLGELISVWRAQREANVRRLR